MMHPLARRVIAPFSIHSSSESKTNYHFTVGERLIKPNLHLGQEISNENAQNNEPIPAQYERETGIRALAGDEFVGDL